MRIKVKEVRKAKGVRQKELASAIGVTPAAVYKYENSGNITVATLEKIAAALDCHIYDLIEEV